MAFAEDSLRAKLSSLNETQDSISTVGQWILFHRRHAERIAQVWTQRVKESPPNKKLTLIYLANEIVQQAKLRKKEEFTRAFDPVIAEGTAAAYKSASSDIQQKIRRVVEVWHHRSIFVKPILADIEKAMDELDKSRSGRKPALGGSLFSGSSVPPELTPVAPLATALQRADLNAKPAITTANQDYEKLTNPNNAIPTPPMHAAGLAALVKKLAVAEGAVAESVKARQALVTGLEKLLETNKTKLGQEETQLADLGTRKDAIELRKREVEDAILKGLSTAETNAISTAPLPAAPARSARSSEAPQERPQVEELTPPPMESFTPVGSPKQAAAAPVPDDVLPRPASNSLEPPAASASSSSTPVPATTMGAPTQPAPEDLLRSLKHAHQQIENTNGMYGQNTYKKRKMSRSEAEDEFAAFAGDGEMDGIDSNLGNLI